MTVLFGFRAFSASVPEEFKIKREQVFEFAEKPVVARQGDKVTISFESKGFCDATVAIENGQGRIIRHLASGVLGPKAPEPFKKNARKQTLGGINVSPSGKIVASCAYRYVGISGRHFNLNKDAMAAQGGEAYKPMVYPGRISNSTAPCIHVWDRHGKLVYEDAVPGVAQVDGVKIDRDENIYFMHTPSRVLDGKKYFNEMSETLTKVKPKKAKVISKSKRAPVPLPESGAPKRPLDIYAGGVGAVWVENAEWFYGGVGYAGFNTAHAGGGCACWFSRFTLDYFARSFAPEPHLFGVAVLDTNGNLILRIGRFGNVDAGKPLVAGPEERQSRSTGGDEVALFHACYVGTHTDRRLFISDVGNGRILSVKLGYHEEAKVALKDVPDGAR